MACITAYGPSRRCSGSAVHALPNVVQSAVIAVADRDHEVLADEDHDLAGLDDLACQRHRFVRDVLDGFQHQEQRVVVALQLGPLMGVHGVLHGQRVQPEDVCDILHLSLVGLVQPDPDERLLSGLPDLADLGQRVCERVLAGQPLAVYVETAIDQRLGGGIGNGMHVLPTRPCDRSQCLRQCVEPWEHVHLRSQRRCVGGGQCYAAGTGADGQSAPSTANSQRADDEQAVLAGPKNLWRWRCASFDPKPRCLLKIVKGAEPT